jgi:hypothetical protein
VRWLVATIAFAIDLAGSRTGEQNRFSRLRRYAADRNEYRQAARLAEKVAYPTTITSTVPAASVTVPEVGVSVTVKPVALLLLTEWKQA